MKLNKEQVLVSAHGINFEYLKSQWYNFMNISHFVLQSDIASYSTSNLHQQ